MWSITTAALITVFTVLSIMRSPQLALGIVVPVSMLFPAWVMLPLFDGARDSIVGSGIDIKVATSAICLVLYCFLPGRTFPARLVPCDFAVLAMILIHITADCLNDGFSWMVLGRAVCEWYLPYVSARVAFQTRATINAVWPVLVTAVAVVAILAITEALLRWNPLEQLFGIRPTEGFNPNTTRWGIRRPVGFTMHPIYLGVVQLLLSGWAFFAMFRARYRRSHHILVLMPLLSAVGIVATASRGPIVGYFAAICVLMFLVFRKLRLAMLGAAILVAAVAVIQQDAVLSVLATWGDEGKPREIMIDDEVRLQSSVRSRLNALAVYSIAFKRAGLLGFGTRAVSGFPINVPVGAREAETLKQVRYVDNAYLLMALRFGYLGLMGFLAMAAIALLQLMLVAKGCAGDSPQWLCWSLVASISGTLVVLLTVWMPHEIGFPLLWTYGVSSGLYWAQLQGVLKP